MVREPGDDREPVRCSSSDEPPVIVDWAPWHHTAAGNHDFGLVIYNGGSYYIDEGKPMPGAIEATVRNLREVAPTWYFNVPRGYEALLPYLRSDAALRDNFFLRLKAAVVRRRRHGAARVRRDQGARAETSGEDILFLTGLGSTETAPYTMGRMWETDDATNMGLPPPGVEIKLVPLEEQVRGARQRAAHHARLLAPARAHRRAFDEEGYYRLGDTFALERAIPARGLLFRGRMAEDFKLSTGTWVHVGPLRASFIEHFAPLVRDVVITGEGRSEVGALVFPAGSRRRGRLARQS